MLLLFCLCIFVRIYVHFVYFGLDIGIVFLQSPAITGDCYILVVLFMVALWNGADHYIFILWFLLSIFLSFFFLFPRLISAVADWMSIILPHMMWP